MRNILSKIYIHPISLFVIILFILLGRFKFIIYYTLIIIIHELGHIVFSIIFNWNIEKIVLLPFGALIKFREKINKPRMEEFIISIGGILFQIIFFLLLNNIIDYKYFSLINLFIICFNILPIYPLDGSKIVNVILNYITNFYKSITITIIISFIFLFLSIKVIEYNKLMLIPIYFLYDEVNKLNKNKKNIFNKFLLERYLFNFNFKNRKTIKSIKEMKKDYKHIFYINNKYKTEKEVLKEIFNK